MKPYKVAIVGNGMICNAAHIPAYKAMGGQVELAAVADIRVEAARETALRHGIPRHYTDAYQMLEEQKPDILSVCTPNAYHKEYTLAGLRAGCHVVCEKHLEKSPASPYKLARLISLFPKAKIIAAHLGGYADGAAAFDALAGKDIWLDTSNTASMDRGQIKAIVANHPREKLLFGSDYPLFDPANEIRLQQERLRFTDTEMHALLHNADGVA